MSGFKGKDHWHHNEGKKHYAPGEECPTSDDAPEADAPDESLPLEDSDFMKRMSEVTGLSGTALLIYLVISEGSRAFPSGKLVPVP